MSMPENQSANNLPDEEYYKQLIAEQSQHKPAYLDQSPSQQPVGPSYQAQQPPAMPMYPQQPPLMPPNYPAQPPYMNYPQPPPGMAPYPQRYNPYAKVQGDPNASGRWMRWFGFNIIALYVAFVVLMVVAQFVLSQGLNEFIRTEDPKVFLKYWNGSSWFLMGIGGAIVGVLLAFIHRGALHNAVDNRQLWFGVTILGSAIAFPLVMFIYVQMVMRGFQIKSSETILLAHMVAGGLAALCIGLPQMFVMRPKVRSAWQWVVVMAVTWILLMTGTIGMFMAMAISI